MSLFRSASSILRPWNSSASSQASKVLGTTNHFKHTFRKAYYTMFFNVTPLVWLSAHEDPYLMAKGNLQSKLIVSLCFKALGQSFNLTNTIPVTGEHKDN